MKIETQVALHIAVFFLVLLGCWKVMEIVMFIIESLSVEGM